MRAEYEREDGMVSTSPCVLDAEKGEERPIGSIHQLNTYEQLAVSGDVTPPG